MRTLWIAMVFLGFSIMASFPAASQNPDKKHSKDIDAIKKTAENFDAAYNSRDAVAFSAYFMEDADFQWHTGELLKDRKQIAQYFTNAFKSMPADYRHITTLQRIRFLGPDIAIGDGTLVIAQDAATENTKPVFSVLFTCIGKKAKGQWKLAAIRLILPERK
jgi:uncharacterized protein (TIGR02246 family)